MAWKPPPAYPTLHKRISNTAATAGETVVDCDKGHNLAANDFEDETTRLGFIQKVLALKLLQQALAALVLGVFAANEWHLYILVSNTLYIVLACVISAAVFVGVVALQVRLSPPDDVTGAGQGEGASRRLRFLFLAAHPIAFAVFTAFLAAYADFLITWVSAWLVCCGALLAVLLFSVFALQTELRFTAARAATLAALTQVAIYAVVIPTPLMYYVTVSLILYPSAALALHCWYVLWVVELMTSPPPRYWRRVARADFADAALWLHIDYYYILTRRIWPKIRGVS